MVKWDLTYFAKSGNTQMVRLVEETKAKAELALETRTLKGVHLKIRELQSGPRKVFPPESEHFSAETV